MNGNKIVLDTNIILYLLSGDNTLATFLDGKEGYVSVITELELIGYPSISPKELQKIKRFLDSCTVVDFNEVIKDIYSSLRRTHQLRLGDAAIAATALYLNIPLISADKAFKKMDELQFTLYSR